MIRPKRAAAVVANRVLGFIETSSEDDSSEDSNCENADLLSESEEDQILTDHNNSDASDVDGDDDLPDASLPRFPV